MRRLEWSEGEHGEGISCEGRKVREVEETGDRNEFCRKDQQQINLKYRLYELRSNHEHH